MHNAKIIQKVITQNQALISFLNTATDANEMKGEEIIKWNKNRWQVFKWNNCQINRIIYARSVGGHLAQSFTHSRTLT